MNIISIIATFLIVIILYRLVKNSYISNWEEELIKTIKPRNKMKRKKPTLKESELFDEYK